MGSAYLITKKQNKKEKKLTRKQYIEYWLTVIYERATLELFSFLEKIECKPIRQFFLSLSRKDPQIVESYNMQIFAAKNNQPVIIKRIIIIYRSTFLLIDI